MKITFIVGLSGSGKSHLADKLGGDLVIDDFDVAYRQDLVGLLALCNGRQHLVITDPTAVAASPKAIVDRLTEMFGDVDVTFIAFENDLAQCITNLSGRGDENEKSVSRHAMVVMSGQYRPENFGQPIPVYRPE